MKDEIASLICVVLTMLAELYENKQITYCMFKESVFLKISYLHEVLRDGSISDDLNLIQDAVTKCENLLGTNGFSCCSSTLHDYAQQQ